MSGPVGLGLLGAGRIGQTHARAIEGVDDARLIAVADPEATMAGAVARRHGARTASVGELLGDPAVEGVLIATPTDIHAELIERAAEAARPIFCEKPIALDLDRARRSVAVADRYRTPLMIGFNRRFDPSFRRLREAVEAGDIGDVELVQITSRDPAPPPIAFVERSGGLFHDMMIHDFDTARSLIGEEIVEVTAMGSVLIDKAIGEAGDVDTGAVMLRSSSGRLALISNSRRATYGYDQRIEVHGAGGMMSAGNPVATTITRADGTGFATDPLCNYFMDRYADAFRFQIEAFCALVRGRDVTYPDGIDGLAALAIADAAVQSLETGRTVAVPDPRFQGTPGAELGSNGKINLAQGI